MSERNDNSRRENGVRSGSPMGENNRNSNRAGSNDRPRSEGGYRGNSDRSRNEGGYQGSNDRSRREGGYQGSNDRPRREGGYQGSNDRPRSEGGYRGSNDRPRREGGYQGSNDRPRREGGYQGSNDRPRREGGYQGSNDRPRSEGGYRGNSDRSRNEGGYQGSNDRPRREGGYQGSNDRPRREGGYQGSNDRPRREGGYQGSNDRPRREGGYQGSNDRPRREGGYQGSNDRPRSEGGYRGNSDRSRNEGGYQGSNDRPRREGGYQGSNDRPRREGERGGRDSAPQYGRGGTRGGGKSDRGGVGREFTEAERLAHELRPVRSEHQDPEIPDNIRAKELHPGARNELKTLQEDVQEKVARHLAMVSILIDTDIELAHAHAVSASRRAGRIAVARETLAITAYRMGDYALALRELRTFRRLSGSDALVSLMVDSERGLGRPEKGIETGLEVDASTLDAEARVLLAIAMSGARLDLGQTAQALMELEIAELDPKMAFTWSPDLFAAYSVVLEDLGRSAEAQMWADRSAQAIAALEAHYGAAEEFETFEVWEQEVEAEESAYDDFADEEFTAEAEAPASAENNTDNEAPRTDEA